MDSLFYTWKVTLVAQVCGHDVVTHSVQERKGRLDKWHFMENRALAILTLWPGLPAMCSPPHHVMLLFLKWLGLDGDAIEASS